MTYLFISPEDEYPRHIGDIYREHVDFDGHTIPEGWKPVIDVESPILEDDETLVEDFPTLINGRYYRSLSKRKLTPEEEERNLQDFKDNKAIG
jgi:hypothetical protein